MMNCEQASDMLIDLVYGELDAVARQGVLGHVRSCARCARELADLQAAREALREHRSAEPPLKAPRFDERQGPSLLARVARRAVPAAAAAAAILLGGLLWMLVEETTPPARAAGAVEIKRQAVSLTILSAPETQGGSVAATQRAIPAPSLGRDGRLSPWAGLAMVRDQRIIRNLPAGQTQVSFTDVPSAILPDTVHLQSLDDPGRLTILEQNYQYDLASAAAVLKRHLDKTLTVHFKDGKTVSGVLLGFDDQTLVIQPAGEGPWTIGRENVRAITFEKLPEGLLTRPTLLWRLENRAAARQRFEVAYLTGGLTWRADYVLKVRPSGEAGEEGGITDAADLVGYATVTNDSGVTYENAQLKLLAGDVNLLPPEDRQPEQEKLLPLWSRASPPPAFQEKSFFEYHLYTLVRPTTLRNAETKQIELISGAGLKMTRAYVYDPAVHTMAARVVSELVNSEANGLGKPLPKGVVRLYAPDPTGEPTYVAQTTIDHTPKDEKLRFTWGYAFDIVCSHLGTDYRISGDDRSFTDEYRLRNHKERDVTITVIVRVPNTTFEARCEDAWHVRQVGLIEIPVRVKANTERTIRFDYSYGVHHGGGLKSPYDSQEREDPQEQQTPKEQKE